MYCLYFQVLSPTQHSVSSQPTFLEGFEKYTERESVSQNTNVSNKAFQELRSSEKVHRMLTLYVVCVYCNSNAKCLVPCQNKNDIYIFTGFRFTKFELDRYLSLFIQSSNYSNLSRGSQRRRLFLEIFLKRKFYVLFIVCKETSTGYKWLKHKKWRNVCHWNCFFSSKREENISFYKVCIFFDLFAQLFHENCSL